MAASSPSCYSLAVELVTRRETALGMVLFIPMFVVPARGVHASRIRVPRTRRRQHAGRGARPRGTCQEVLWRRAPVHVQACPFAWQRETVTAAVWFSAASVTKVLQRMPRRLEGSPATTLSDGSCTRLSGQQKLCTPPVPGSPSLDPAIFS